MRPLMAFARLTCMAVEMRRPKHGDTQLARATSRGWRAASGLFCLLALWAAYLQLNDPDPERWAAMYLACAGAAFMCALGRGSAWLCAAVAGVALLWATAIAPELARNWGPR